MKLASNATILEELRKSGGEFSELFVQHKAQFTPLIQSGNEPRIKSDRYVAQVNDVLTVAYHMSESNSWKFKTYVVVI